MKNIFSFFIIIFLLPCLSDAQSPTYLKVGINHSSFRTEGGKGQIGSYIGIGKEYYPIKTFNGFLGIDLTNIRKKIDVVNKSWPAGFDPTDSDVVIGDIHISIEYLEIPIKAGYSIPINDRSSLSFFTGYAISIPIKNHTSGKQNEIIHLSPDERGKYIFDYVRWDDVKINTSRNFQFGARFVYKPIVLEASYSRALQKTEGFSILIIRDKLDSYQVAVGYTF